MMRRAKIILRSKNNKGLERAPYTFSFVKKGYHDNKARKI